MRSKTKPINKNKICISKQKGQFKCGNCTKTYNGYASFYAHCRRQHSGLIDPDSTFNQRSFDCPTGRTGRPRKSIQNQNSRSSGNNDTDFSEQKIYIDAVSAVTQFSWQRVELIYQFFHKTKPLPKSKKSTKSEIGPEDNLSETKLQIAARRVTRMMSLSQDLKKLDFFENFFTCLQDIEHLVCKLEVPESKDPFSQPRQSDNLDPLLMIEQEFSSQYTEIDPSNIQEILRALKNYQYIFAGNIPKFDQLSNKLQSRVIFQQATLVWMSHILTPSLMPQILHLTVSLLFEELELEFAKSSIFDVLNTADMNEGKEKADSKQQVIWTQNQFNDRIRTLVRQPTNLSRLDSAFKEAFCHHRYKSMKEIDLF